MKWWYCSQLRFRLNSTGTRLISQHRGLELWTNGRLSVSKSLSLRESFIVWQKSKKEWKRNFTTSNAFLQSNWFPCVNCILVALCLPRVVGAIIWFKTFKFDKRASFDLLPLRFNEVRRKVLIETNRNDHLMALRNEASIDANKLLVTRAKKCVYLLLCRATPPGAVCLATLRSLSRFQWTVEHLDSSVHMLLFCEVEVKRVRLIRANSSFS